MIATWARRAVSEADWGRMRNLRFANSLRHGFAVPPPSEREAYVFMAPTTVQQEDALHPH